MDSSNYSYTVSLSDRERAAVIFALGNIFPHLVDSPGGFFLARPEFLNLSKRIMEMRPDGQAARSMSGTAAAQAIASRPTPPAQSSPEMPAAVELKDRWQKSTKGIEIPFPEGCAKIEAVIFKIEDAPPRNDKNRPRKKVTWEVGAPQGGRGYMDAFCWDIDLFPFLANRIKQRTTFYIVRAGQYTNFVGIHA